MTQKLSDFAKTADLDVNTLVEEQLNDLVLQKVRSWIKKIRQTPSKNHDISQSKALLSYLNRFEQLFTDEQTKLLGYNKTVQETSKAEMKRYVPLPLFYHSSDWLTHIATVVILENSNPLKIYDNTSGQDDTNGLFIS